MKLNIIAITAGALLLASCEKEIIVDVPPHEPKLAINSVTYTGDTISVMLGKSIDVLKHKYGTNLGVPDAVVQLQAGDKATVTMKYDNTSGAYISDMVAEPGLVYSVKAVAPGFSEVSAISRAPRAVKIQSLQRIKDVRLDMDGNTQDELRLTFDDPAGEKNYYIITISASFMVNNYEETAYSGCVNTPDPSVETLYDESIDQNTCIESNGIFLRDELFDGKRKELRLFVRSTDLQAQEVPGLGMVYPTIEIQHVTEEYFRYIKSSRYASINSGNPFAEPSNVYTNIKGGFGIFSIAHSEVMEIK